MLYAWVPFVVIRLLDHADPDKLIAVGAAILVAGIAADNVSDWKTKTALIASQYAVAGYSALRRGADTRSWPTLPKTVYLARVQRPADGVLRVTADGIDVVKAEIPEGCSMVFVRKPSAGAVPSVKVVSWPAAK